MEDLALYRARIGLFAARADKKSSAGSKHKSHGTKKSLIAIKSNKTSLGRKPKSHGTKKSLSATKSSKASDQSKEKPRKHRPHCHLGLVLLLVLAFCSLEDKTSHFLSVSSLGKFLLPGNITAELGRITSVQQAVCYHQSTCFCEFCLPLMKNYDYYNEVYMADSRKQDLMRPEICTVSNNSSVLLYMDTTTSIIEALVMCSDVIHNSTRLFHTDTKTPFVEVSVMCAAVLHNSTGLFHTNTTTPKAPEMCTDVLHMSTSLFHTNTTTPEAPEMCTDVLHKSTGLFHTDTITPIIEAPVMCTDVLHNYTGLFHTDTIAPIIEAPVMCTDAIHNSTGLFHTNTTMSVIYPPMLCTDAIHSSTGLFQTNMTPLEAPDYTVTTLGSRTCCYLLGNKGCHSYNGNPTDTPEAWLTAATLALIKKHVDESVGYITIKSMDVHAGEMGRGCGTGFRVGDCYMMTAYHVYRDTIGQIFEDILFELEPKWSEINIKDLLRVLEMTDFEVGESRENNNIVVKKIFNKFMKDKASNTALLIQRLEGLIDTGSFISELENKWNQNCVVDFINHGRFSVDWKIEFGDQESDIIIVKLNAKVGQSFPKPMLLDENFMDHGDIHVIRYICDGSPKIIMDQDTQEFKEDDELRENVEAAVQWWKSNFPTEPQDFFKDCYKSCNKAHNEESGCVVLRASKRSFKHGASGSPIVYSFNRTGQPIVGMIFQRGFPEFYYSAHLEYSSKYKRFKGTQVDKKCFFEGGTTMKKAAELLQRYNRHELKANVFSSRELEVHVVNVEDLKSLLHTQIVQEFTTLRESQSTEIENIRSEVQQVATVTENVRSEVQQVATVTENVRSEVQQVATVTENIRSEVQQVAAMTENVRSEVQQVAAMTENVRSEVQQVATVTENVRSEVQHVAAATENIRSEVQQVAAETENVRSEAQQVREEMMTRGETSSKNPTDAMALYVESWKEQDKLCYETKGVQAVKEKICNQSYVCVIGVPGSGKSTAIRHAALHLQETSKYSIYPLRTLEEFDKYLDKDRKQVFVMDDVVGEYSVDKEMLGSWDRLNDRVKSCLGVSKNTKFLTSLRRQLYLDETLKGKTYIFNDTEKKVDFTDEDYKLSRDDMTNMLRHYLEVRNVANIEALIWRIWWWWRLEGGERCGGWEKYRGLWGDEVAKSADCFPLLCKVFSDNESVRKDPRKFFRDPFPALTDIFRQIKTKNKHQFCGLLLCAFTELKPGYFSPHYPHDKPKIFISLIKSQNLDPEKDLDDIKKALQALDGVYVSQVANKYDFSHSTFRDITTFLYEDQYVIFQHATLGFIESRVRLFSKLSEDDDYVLVFGEDCVELLANRMIHELKCQPWWWGKGARFIVDNRYIDDERVVNGLCTKLFDSQDTDITQDMVGGLFGRCTEAVGRYCDDHRDNRDVMSWRCHKLLMNMFSSFDCTRQKYVIFQHATLDFINSRVRLFSKLSEDDDYVLVFGEDCVELLLNRMIHELKCQTWRREGARFIVDNRCIDDERVVNGLCTKLFDSQDTYITQEMVGWLFGRCMLAVWEYCRDHRDNRDEMSWPCYKLLERLIPRVDCARQVGWWTYPVLRCVGTGSVSLSKLVVQQNNVDINVVDVLDQSVLHYALRCGNNVEMTRYLLSLPNLTQLNHRDRWHKTLYWYVIRGTDWRGGEIANRQDMMDMYKQAGAIALGD